MSRFFMDIIFRKFKIEDTAAVISLFRNTVRSVNRQHYTEEQTKAWAPDIIYEDKWADKLQKHYTVVAELKGVICGFGDIDDTGYFDHLFVHKDYQRKGIAAGITERIEDYAVQMGIKVITVAVSITAKPFFTAKGYSLLRQQEVEFNGQVFTNFQMEKKLI
jgi:putative acetyltransferase